MAMIPSLRGKGAMSDIHPLDTPEILSLIAAFLPRSDLANGCAVAKCWLRPFASQLWRSIQAGLFEKRAFVRALPRYQVFVRVLECPLLCPVFSRLTHLRNLIAFTSPKIHQDSADWMLSVLQTHRTSLRRLNLLLGNVPTLPERTLQVVSTLSSLRSLSLECCSFELFAIEFILDRIPTLRELHVIQETSPTDGNASSLPRCIREWDRERENKRASYRLRSFGLITHEFTFYPLVSIVESSPYLEQLLIKSNERPVLRLSISTGCQELAHTLRRYCPRLRDLQLGGYWIQMNELRYLLGLEMPTDPSQAALLMPSSISTEPAQDKWIALRCLHIYSSHYEINGGINGEQVLGAVLRGKDILAGTLEELIIDHAAPDEQDLTTMVLDLLGHFRKLRIFKGGAVMVRARHLFRRDPFQKHPADGSRELSLKPWVCRDLEYMQVNFVDPYDAWFPLLTERLFTGVYSLETNMDMFSGQFPVYLAIKCHLSLFTNLDQTGIRFSRLY